MSFALVWIAIGCMVGAMAADRRGISMPVALIAGGLLGILSPLMFFVRPPIPMRRCPKCAENVRADAVLCRYCRSELKAVVIDTESVSTSMARVVIFSVLGFGAILGTLVGVGFLVKMFG